MTNHLRGVVALVASLSLPLHAQRTPDVRINTSPPGSGGPAAFGYDIAASGDSVFAVWTDDRAGAGLNDVRFNRSVDRGVTWLTNDLRVNTGVPSASASAPQLVATGGAVCVAWRDERNGLADVYVNRSVDGGATWLPADVRVNTDAAGASAASMPAIAAVGMTVFAAWVDDRTGSPDTYFNRSSDGGATWLAADVRLDSDLVGAWDSKTLTLAVSGSTVHAFWIESQLVGPNLVMNLRFNRSVDGGATWLPTDLIVEPGFEGASYSVVASGSVVAVAWQDARNGSLDVFLKRSIDSGATWPTSPIRLDTDLPGAAASWTVNLAFDGTRMRAVWADQRCGTACWEIRTNASDDAGATWLSADEKISTDRLAFTILAAPQVTMTTDGAVVTWMDLKSTGGIDIYCNRTVPGSGWLATDRKLDSKPAGSFSSIGTGLVAEGDRVHAIWKDNRNGGEDLYFTVPFGLLPYGVGKAGSGAVVPELAGTGLPAIGTAFALEASLGLGGASAALLIGAAKATTPILGGTVLLTPLLAPAVLLGGAAGVPGAGTLSLPLSLPADEALVGGALFFQILVLDAGATGGVSMTSGLELWIG